MEFNFSTTQYYYGICSVEISAPNEKYAFVIDKYLKLNCFEKKRNQKLDTEIKFVIVVDEKHKTNFYGFETKKLKHYMKIHNKTQYEEEKYALCYEEKECIYYYNIHLKCYVKYDKKKELFIVLGDIENAAEQTLDIMREQIIPKSIESNGSVFLKCAAFVYKNNEAALLIGSSESGKTTILLNALKNNLNYKYICNSAAYLQKNTEIELLAWRPHMRIRAGTAKNFPNVVKYINSLYNQDVLKNFNSNEDVLCIKTYDEFNKFFSNDYCTCAIPKKVFMLNSTDDMWSSHLRYGYDKAHPDYLCLEKLEESSDTYSKKYEQIKIGLIEQCQFIKLDVDINQIENTLNVIRSCLY